MHSTVAAAGNGARRGKALVAFTGAALGFALLATWAHAAAPAGRYTISTDTVRDNWTMLVWQRAVPTAPTGCTVGTDSHQCTQDEATAYCTSLNTSGGIGGITTGWRLPTAKELSSLVDDSATDDPCIDRTAFPDTPGVDGGFWSSSPYAAVYHDGLISGEVPANPHLVRCVR